MPTPLEVDEENKYVSWAKGADIICEKVKFMTTGYPDRLSVLPNGLTVWIEFKRRGEEPEPIQSYRMNALRKQGALVGWTDDSSIAIRAVQALLDASRLPETGDQAIAVAIERWALLRSWAGENLNLFGCT